MSVREGNYAISWLCFSDDCRRTRECLVLHHKSSQIIFIFGFLSLNRSHLAFYGYCSTKFHPIVRLFDWMPCSNKVFDCSIVAGLETFNLQCSPNLLVYCIRVTANSTDIRVNCVSLCILIFFLCKHKQSIEQLKFPWERGMEIWKMAPRYGFIWQYICAIFHICSFYVSKLKTTCSQRDTTGTCSWERATITKNCDNLTTRKRSCRRTWSSWYETMYK